LLPITVTRSLSMTEVSCENTQLESSDGALLLMKWQASSGANDYRIMPGKTSVITMGLRVTGR
jgi:hypothetical protein